MFEFCVLTFWKLCLIVVEDRKMKKKMIVIVALLMCLTVGSANADLVYDSFENAALGTPTVTVDGNGDQVSSLMPDVGPVAWTRYVGQEEGSPVISGDVAYTGAQSQKHVRPAGCVSRKQFFHLRVWQDRILH